MMEKIILKLFKRKFIRDYRRYCQSKTGHALVYYVTDSFVFRKLADDYTHIFYWEVLEIAKILNKLGFWVDVVDRSIGSDEINSIENKYDIFIGIGAGNSGKYFSDIAQKLSRAVKIFYAAGPEPNLSNKLIYRRYEYFFQRHPGSRMKLRRIINKVNIDQAMDQTDVIFCIGNEFALESYKKFNKKIYRIYPSTFPRINFSLKQLFSRSQKKFLYFGGNGNIVKGLDLVIEAFSGLSNLQLYICTSKTENDFNKFYEKTLKNSNNIHFLGFIKVGSRVFEKVSSECGYVILPSCSEGTATSVATCMRKGLVPIVTYETGIDLEDFGFLIKDIEIDKLKNQIENISSISSKEFLERSVKSYLASFNYTQAKFSESFEKALINVLFKKRCIL